MTDPAGIPWRSRTVQAIFASTLILPLGVAMLSPLLPAIRDQFGIGDPGASLVMSVYYLPAMLLSPILGVVIDRIGRRIVLVAALLSWGLAGSVMAFGPTFEVLLMMRLIQGTAAAAVVISTITIIGDLFAGVQRNAVIGVNAAVLFVGAAIAPVIGGGLVAYGWNAPFVLFLLGFPVAILAWYGVDETGLNSVHSGLDYLRKAFQALPVRRALGLYGVAILLDFVSFGVIITVIPFLLESTYGTPPLVIGAVITANLVISALAAAANGRLAARSTETTLIATGFGIIGLSLFGAWQAVGGLQFVLAAALFGAGYGVIYPSIDAAITTLSPSEFRAGALSLRNSASFLGRGGGPVVFALAATGIGYRSVLLVAGVGMGTLSVFSVLTRRL